MIFSKLFGKKQMNQQAAQLFWQFFASKQEQFIAILSGDDMASKQAVVNGVDYALCQVFPYEKGENIQFELGCNEGENELRLFHSGRPQLEKDMNALCNMAPEAVRNVWNISVSE